MFVESIESLLLVAYNLDRRMEFAVNFVELVQLWELGRRADGETGWRWKLLGEVEFWGVER